MPKVTFLSRQGQVHTIQALKEQTLLDAILKHDPDIEGACGGGLACATCHVVVDPEWYLRLSPPRREESEMLELAKGLTPTSRLACQIRLDDTLDGLKVALPK